MLKFLRKKENIKRIVWGLAIVIIPAFVLWGSGSALRSRGQPKYAGKIFGKRVSFRQYEAGLAGFRTQALLIYGENFQRMAKYLDLEKEVWERLILLAQAKKARVKVADREVIDFIEQLPLFQKEGRFDQERYNILLEYAFRSSPRDFEEQIREMLKVDKLKSQVIKEVALEDEQIKEAYRNEKEKVKALYIFVDPQEFTEQVHPAYEELEAYHQSHKTEFRKSMQVNVEYLALYFDQAAAEEFSITEEEIQDYYASYPEQFSAQDKGDSIKPLEEVKAQIKERLTQEKIKAQLEQKIWQVSDEIEDTPESFADTAKRHQLEVKETGFFGPEELIPEIGLSFEFLNAAFSLKKDEVSNVIETPRGYFIIKVKGKKEAYIPELDEVKERVEQAVIRQSSRQLAEDKGKELAAQIQKLFAEEELNFAKAAEKLSLTIQETEEFSRASYIAGIGQSPDFAQAAFTLKPGQASELISVPNGYCILSPKEIIPIDEEVFVQEKEEFSKQLLAKKQAAFFRTWLAEVIKEARLVSNLGNLRQ